MFLCEYKFSFFYDNYLGVQLLVLWEIYVYLLWETTKPHSKMAILFYICTINAWDIELESFKYDNHIDLYV